jgi:hypothetical protein
VWDQEACIGRWHGREMRFTAEFNAFRGTLGMGAVLCQRGDPEAKGLVERANGYLETSFLPGRRFADLDDFNRQLHGWLVRANNLDIGANTFMQSCKTLMGVVEGDSVADVVVPQLLDLYVQGRFPFDRLVQFYDFDQINQAAADTEAGTTVKPILRIS